VDENRPFICPKQPGNLKLGPIGCAAMYRKAHDPRSWMTKNGAPPTLAMHFRAPSLLHCYDCEIGHKHAESSLLAPLKTPQQKKAFPVVECMVEGCRLRAQCRGLCNNHYAAWRKGRLPGFCEWLPGPGNAEKAKEEEKKPMEEKQAGHKPEPESHTCRRCGKTVKGKDKIETEFMRHNMTGVLEGVCKTCKYGRTATKLRARHEKQRQNEAADPYKIVLDFSEHPGLYSRLQQAAQKEMRDIPHQALWLLQQGIIGG
jgi:hypothetical protein